MGKGRGAFAAFALCAPLVAGLGVAARQSGSQAVCQTPSPPVAEVSGDVTPNPQPTNLLGGVPILESVQLVVRGTTVSGEFRLSHETVYELFHGATRPASDYPAESFDVVLVTTGGQLLVKIDFDNSNVFSIVTSHADHEAHGHVALRGDGRVDYSISGHGIPSLPQALRWGASYGAGVGGSTGATEFLVNQSQWCPASFSSVVSVARRVSPSALSPYPSPTSAAHPAAGQSSSTTSTTTTSDASSVAQARQAALANTRYGPGDIGNGGLCPYRITTDVRLSASDPSWAIFRWEGTNGLCQGGFEVLNMASGTWQVVGGGDVTGVFTSEPVPASVTAEWADLRIAHFKVDPNAANPSPG